MTDPSIIAIDAEIRTEFGKGAARRIRAVGKVPAVLYEKGIEPHHLTLTALDFARAVRGDANRVLSFQIDGKEVLALPRAIVRHPIKDYLQHVDLLIVHRGERVSAEVPVHLVGDAAPGTLVLHETAMITIEMDALTIPERIEVPLDGREAGEIIHAAAVVLPEGAVLVTDPETVIAAVTAQAAVTDDTEEEAAAPAAPAAAEPAGDEA